MKRAVLILYPSYKFRNVDILSLIMLFVSWDVIPRKPSQLISLPQNIMQAAFNFYHFKEIYSYVFISIYVLLYIFIRETNNNVFNSSQQREGNFGLIKLFFTTFSLLFCYFLLLIPFYLHLLKMNGYPENKFVCRIVDINTTF